MKIDEIKKYLSEDKKDEFIKITNEELQPNDTLDKISIKG